MKNANFFFYYYYCRPASLIIRLSRTFYHYGWDSDSLCIFSPKVCCARRSSAHTQWRNCKKPWEGRVVKNNHCFKISWCRQAFLWDRQATQSILAQLCFSNASNEKTIFHKRCGICFYHINNPIRKSLDVGYSILFVIVCSLYIINNFYFCCNIQIMSSARSSNKIVIYTNTNCRFGLYCSSIP